MSIYINRILVELISGCLSFCVSVQAIIEVKIGAIKIQNLFEKNIKCYYSNYKYKCINKLNISISVLPVNFIRYISVNMCVKYLNDNDWECLFKHLTLMSKVKSDENFPESLIRRKTSQHQLGLAFQLIGIM